MSNFLSRRLTDAFEGCFTGLKLPFPLTGENVSYPMFARNGLFAVMQRIRLLTNSRTVLLPSYTCGDEVEAIIQAGFKVTSFSINNKLQADPDDIYSLLDDDTAAILLTHYFGFPQNSLGDIASIAKKKGVFLVEDCAHVLSSETADGLVLGTIGDASIFSLRKYFPIPHGGVLVINNKDIAPTVFLEPDDTAQDKDLFIFLAQNIGYFKKGTSIAQIYSEMGLKIEKLQGPRYQEFGGYQLGMTTLAKILLTGIDWQVISEGHRNRFQRLLSVCERGSLNVQPIFKHLPSKCTPLIFPVNMTGSSNSTGERTHDVRPYWTFFHPRVDLSQHIVAKTLKEHLGAISLEEDC